MIPRRQVLTGALALTVLPRFARAEIPLFTLRGSLEQGSLVTGHANPDATLLLDGAPLTLSPDGAFAFGIAYDRTAPLRLVARLGDGRGEVRDISPVPRIYQTQSITGLPQAYVTPPPDILARIRAEAAAVAEARKRDTPGTGFQSVFQWPVAGTISGVFGSRRILNGTPMAPHMGVDIAAPEGTPIHAAADGVVSLVQAEYLGGHVTLIDHGQGVSTVYLHQQEILVRAGEKVAQGQVIGRVGQTGRATGPNLHWGLNWFQVRLDPSRSTASAEPAPS